MNPLYYSKEVIHHPGRKNANFLYPVKYDEKLAVILSELK